MNHPTQEDLVSYLFLDMGEPPSAAAIEAHLDHCASCRDEASLLRHVLAEVSEADEVPERPVDYPSQVWERVSAGLPPAVKRVGRSPVRLRTLLAAAAVVLLATFLAGRFSARSTSSDLERNREGDVRERVLLVALSEHVEESQVLLVELANRDDGARASSLDRQKAEELLRASRLYRQSAYRLGDVATADLLEDLERLLLDVSHAPDSGEAQKSIQDRIRDQDMLFKLRVLDASVKSREQKLAIKKF